MDGSFSSALTTKDDEDGLSLSGSFGTVEPTYRQRIRRPLFGLVVYHLHKRATEVDCTLAFVREGKEEIEGTDTIGSNEMGMLIRRVAMGLPLVVMERTADNGEGGGKSVAVHLLGGHDAELIRGAMLRNASCEGAWDASKDDLSTALPLPSSKSASGSNRERKGGDVWLEFGWIGNRLLLQARVCIDKQRAT